MRSLMCFLLFFLIFFPIHSQGFWEPSTIISPTGETIYNPKVAVARNGNAIAVWGNTLAAGNRSVEANVFDKEINSWSSSFELYPLGENIVIIGVAIDEMGYAIAIWENATLQKIQAVRIQLSTQTISPIQTFYGTSAQNPDIAMDAAGNAVAIWSDNLGTMKIVYSLYDVVLNTWSSPLPITTQILSEVEGNVSMNQNGNAVAVWRRNSITQTAILYKGASSWTPQITLTQGGVSAGQRVALSDSNIASFCWGTYMFSPPYDNVQVRRMNIDTLVLEPLQNYNVIDFGVFPPELATDPLGNTLVVFDEKNTPTTTKMLYLYYNVKEGLWSQTLKRITTQNENETDGFVSMDSCGNGVAVWTDTTHSKVQAAFFFSCTQTWSIPTTILGENSRLPDVGMDKNGNAIGIGDNRSFEAVEAAMGTISPLPAQNLKILQIKNRFATQSTKTNKITFSASDTPSIYISEYRLFRNNTQIATFSPQGPFIYYDTEFSKEMAVTYKVVVVEVNGTKSCPISSTVWS